MRQAVLSSYRKSVLPQEQPEVNYPDLDLDLLRCFACVVTERGFTAAGQVMGLTQSAISLKIKRLEDLINRRVFDRSSRHLALTPDGDILLAYAHRLLSLNDEAVRRLVASPIKGHLRLGVADHFLPYHLAQIVGRFHRTYPAVRLEIEVGRCAELRTACDEGRFDLVIGRRRAGDTMGMPIWTETMVWVAANDFRMPERDKPLPLATLSTGCMFRERALDVLSRARIPHELRYTSTSLLGIIAFVQEGLCISPLGRSDVPSGLKEIDSLPALGNSEIAVFGDTSEENLELVQPLIDLFRDDLGSGRKSSTSP
ncbi:Transcriptional regulator, LysR family [Granulibacter bethesdensis]|uniref:LysR family transcriptional regulator n=1 Tax=Granulibacter bethesdensis TaxID=364410 RepID=UPI00090C347D|nr:LysR substrate-binding domain-containing protein [Granulibacter bethesdensis]APH57935.1 Transcriptional regulator, LysR family [Granulibacter bethesdensis]